MTAGGTRSAARGPRAVPRARRQGSRDPCTASRRAGRRARHDRRPVAARRAARGASRPRWPVADAATRPPTEPAAARRAPPAVRGRSPPRAAADGVCWTWTLGVAPVSAGAPRLRTAPERSSPARADPRATIGTRDQSSASRRAAARWVARRSRRARAPSAPVCATGSLDRRWDQRAPRSAPRVMD